MKNIIFIAPPAAGKGTHSKRLQDSYNYVHISTGDMLREAIAADTPLGREVKDIISKGNFVSDEIVIELIKNKLDQEKGKPFILDGFPRTLMQAKALDEFLKEKNLDYQVIYLDILEETAKRRITGRLTCECGKSYNIYEEAFKPKVDGICDNCGKSLIKRDDDNEESFKIRYQTYMEKTAPIIAYYENNNKIIKIDANKEADLVFKDIVGVINDKY